MIGRDSVLRLYAIFKLIFTMSHPFQHEIKILNSEEFRHTVSWLQSLQHLIEEMQVSFLVSGTFCLHNMCTVKH